MGKQNCFSCRNLHQICNEICSALSTARPLACLSLSIYRLTTKLQCFSSVMNRISKRKTKYRNVMSWRWKYLEICDARSAIKSHIVKFLCLHRRVVFDIWSHLKMILWDPKKHLISLQSIALSIKEKTQKLLLNVIADTPFLGSRFSCRFLLTMSASNPMKASDNHGNAGTPNYGLMI